jgi:hypothetical protein
MSRLLRILFLGLATLYVLWSVWNYYRTDQDIPAIRWNVLKKPIEFIEGKEYTGVFNVDVDAQHEVEVSFSRSMPDINLDSLIGDIDTLIADSNKSVILPISLSIWADSTLVLKIDSVDSKSYSATAERRGRIIGGFSAGVNKCYHVSLKMHKTIKALTRTMPLLTISPIPSVAKQIVLAKELNRAETTISLWTSIATFVLLLGVNIYSEKRNRFTNLKRKSENASIS